MLHTAVALTWHTGFCVTFLWQDADEKVEVWVSGVLLACSGCSNNLQEYYKYYWQRHTVLQNITLALPALNQGTTGNDQELPFAKIHTAHPSVTLLVEHLALSAHRCVQPCCMCLISALLHLEVLTRRSFAWHLALQYHSPHQEHRKLAPAAHNGYDWLDCPVGMCGCA